MQPGEPYVSIGYHRSLDELSPEIDLPIFRRMVGGGPVYIDDGQFFFQIVVPVSMTPALRSEAVRTLLEPAVRAFNDVGIEASLDDRNEVVLGDRKICGHAAGQIEEAVVVVGNLITSFDHASAASVVSAPSKAAHREFLGQMKRYVLATPAHPEEFLTAAANAYASGLGLHPRPGHLDESELSHLVEIDRRFLSSDWLDGPERRTSEIWRAKVKSGVWVGSAALNGYRVTASFNQGELGSVLVEGAGGPFPGMDELLAEMAGSPPI
jgi:lipoate-protein ligase A